MGLRPPTKLVSENNSPFVERSLSKNNSSAFAHSFPAKKSKGVDVSAISIDSAPAEGSVSLSEICAGMIMARLPFVFPAMVVLVILSLLAGSAAGCRLGRRSRVRKGRIQGHRLSYNYVCKRYNNPHRRGYGYNVDTLTSCSLGGHRTAASSYVKVGMYTYHCHQQITLRKSRADSSATFRLTGCYLPNGRLGILQ